MALNLHNVEKSAFHHGVYIGHGANAVWTIRWNGRDWRATPQQTAHYLRFGAVERGTLREISNALEALTLETL